MASRSIECLRCGQCCGNCPYLMRLENGKTACLIYEKRLGTVIGMGYHCGLRSETEYDFEGCPYNSGKPIHKG